MAESSMADIVFLDVCGQKFKTYRSTLKKCPMLDGMFKAGENTIFLDMNVINFSHVLEFLRFSEYKVPQSCRYILDVLLIPYTDRNIKYTLTEHTKFTVSKELVSFVKNQPSNRYIAPSGLTIFVASYCTGSLYEKIKKDLYISTCDIVNNCIKYSAITGGDDLLDDQWVLNNALVEIQQYYA